MKFVDDDDDDDDDEPCCWLSLACAPVLVYVALSCMSAVVMYFVAVCLRFE